LANHINALPEKKMMKIMFLRESEGVYRFGQKRVNVKVEAGNQVQVRVGGGFLSVEEFIKQYEHGEVDQIQRRNTSNRFYDTLKA